MEQGVLEHVFSRHGFGRKEMKRPGVIGWYGVAKKYVKRKVATELLRETYLIALINTVTPITFAIPLPRGSPKVLIRFESSMRQ